MVKPITGPFCSELKVILASSDAHYKKKKARKRHGNQRVRDEKMVEVLMRDIMNGDYNPAAADDVCLTCNRKRVLNAQHRIAAL